jgi:TonB family protein
MPMTNLSSCSAHSLRCVPKLRSTIFLLFFCSSSFVYFIFSSSSSFGQSTLELDDFNAAYLQYGETKDSEPEIAREAARRAYELGKELFGVNSERSAMLAINYATLISDESASQALLDEAVEIYQIVFGFGSEAMIDPLMRLGRTLNDQGRAVLASQYYRRALQLAENHSGTDSSKTGSIEIELGSINLREGELTEAWERIQRAKTILSNYSDAGSQSGLTRIELLAGEYFLARNQYQNAIEPLLNALAKFERFPGSNVAVRNRIALIKAYENSNQQSLATIQCLAIGESRRLGVNENLRPVYRVSTEALRNHGIDGGIQVEFLVDREGFVKNPQLLTSLTDSALSQQVLETIQRFRFAPRFVNGSVVESPDQIYTFH